MAFVLLAVLAVAGCAARPVGEVKAQSDLTFKGIVRQQLDFSCGASAMATLLNTLYEEKFTEADLLKVFEENLVVDDWQTKIKNGFSFEDLLIAANALGYQAEGVRVGLASLLKAKYPVIIHLEKNTFSHFSVFVRNEDGVIVTFDPIIGRTMNDPALFAKEYSGYALVVWKEGENPLFGGKEGERFAGKPMLGVYDSLRSVVQPRVVTF